MTAALKRLNLGKTSKKAKGAAATANAYASLCDDAESLNNDALAGDEPVENTQTLLNDTNGACAEPTARDYGALAGTADIDGDWTVAGTHRNRNRDQTHTANPVSDVRQVNWRAPNGGTLATRQNIGRTIGTQRTRVTQQSRMTYRGGPRTRNGILLADIYPGVIMWRYDKRPCLDPNIKNDDPRVFFDGDGMKWLRKGRFWVVIYRCRDHVTELPIYTYNDKGLEKKPEAVKANYNSIKPPNTTNYVNQSPNQKVLDIGWVKSATENLRKTMVVHVTEPISRDIDVESRVVGGLNGEALKEILCRAKEPVGTTFEY